MVVGESTSRGYGRTATEVPFIEAHEFRELSSRTFRSLEEQLYMKKAQMKRQPQQHAAILIPGQTVELVKTPTLEEFPISASLRKEFRHACFDLAGCFKQPQEVERELQRLEEKLLVGETAEQRISVETQDEEFLE